LRSCQAFAPSRVCQINRARNLRYKRTSWFFDTLPYL